MTLDKLEIKIIDHKIETFKTQTDFDALWNDFAEFLVEVLKIDNGDKKNLRQIFNVHIPFGTKKFISHCLLRIFNNAPVAITYNQSLYISTINLFDQTLTDVYKACGLKQNSQGYEKQSQLSAYIIKIEKEIISYLSVASLKEINSFESKFKRTVSEGKYSDIVSVFLCDFKWESYVSKVIKSVNNYIKSINRNKLNEYEKTLHEINVLLTLAQEVNTKYSKLFIETPFLEIKKLVQEDFASCNISKPALLEVKLTGKKYPFLVKNEKFSVSFEIVNLAEGYAYDVVIRMVDYNEEIKFCNQALDVGIVDSQKIIRNIDCQVIEPEEVAFIIMAIEWKDFDGEKKARKFEFELVSQKVAIDWEQLKLKQPYSLKPVENENDLIGRSEKLNSLIALTRNSDSCFIIGQKRIGKTSLVKILRDKIEKENSLKVIPIYVSLQLEPILINTIDSLARRICASIKLSDGRLSNLNIPEINHSFASIYDFLLDVTNIIRDHKILIIIDEFDQLPLELYRRGDIGDALFNAFKNLSTEAKFSFILVGGEKMSFIKNVQAIHLNLFKTFSLDYFDSETSWNDFKELVRYPVKNDLEIDESAIRFLYSYTLGHPYFTKKICQELYTICINKHDSHVTEEEMKQAVTQAIHTSDVTDFAHFWDDGIMEKGDKQEETSVLRRKILLSLIELQKNNSYININGTSQIQYQSFSENDFTNIMNEFVLRQILKKTDEGVVFRVKFFSEWLEKHGHEKMFTTPSDEKSISERKRNEAIAQIKPEEVLELVKYWSPYNGKEITTDKIRVWINQFGPDSINQRLMFKLLQNLLFYDNNLIRTACREIYKTIIRKLAQEGLERVVDSSKRKRDDIIVSYLENSFAKSGSEYAKIFADENSLYADKAVVRNKLREYLENNTSTKVLVFLDDFAGTGESICKNIMEINENFGDIFKKRNLIIIISVICGFEDAKRKIELFCERMTFSIEIIFSKILDESDKCFSEYSKVFPLIGERNLAKSICLEYGERIGERNPLGYGNCQALVVFPNAIPNNSLPILWKETSSWIPLFKRQ